MRQQVLLVDDEQRIVDGLKRALRHEPYDVTGVASAREALAFIRHTQVDVIVSDEQMPGMTGTELLAVLREHHPETIGIMLTGQASLDVAVRAINSGEIYRFFVKPCSETELAAAIREALKQKALITQSRRLVDAMRHQAQYIEHLEKQNPGITTVTRTPTGAVVIDKAETLETVLQEVTEELDHAAKRLHSLKGHKAK